MNLLESGGTFPSFRSGRRPAQDLDLRLGRPKNASTRSSGQTITIVVEDDDDEVRVSSPPHPAAQVRSSCFRPYRPVHVPVLDDEDLELRLGLAGETESSMARIRAPARPVEQNPQGACLGLSLRAAIDLTSANNEFGAIPRITGKRKQVESSPEPSKEVRLTCAICMDTMREETSTVCGHIFCRACISRAVQSQKKCPTCRKKLTNSNIHRIYFSSSTS